MSVVTVLWYLIEGLLVYFLGCFVYVRIRRSGRVIGVFHPYWYFLDSTAGGGGERVLFAVLKTLTIHYPNSRIVVYTGDPDSSESIFSRAQSYFAIDLQDSHIEFVRLRLRRWIEADRYPVCTLLGQFCGSALLMQEAVLRLPPHILVDTHGHAFGYWFVRLICWAPVIAYVHYPAIRCESPSTDMIQRVRELRPGYNNSSRITQHATMSRGKLIYYQVLYRLYSLMGRFTSLAVCNSSWTKNHIQRLWATPSTVVYPPCNIVRFLDLPFQKSSTVFIAVSVGQFRPEKDHELQIDAFATFLSAHPEFSQAKLQLIGSCRGPDDEARVTSLRKRAENKGIESAVEFHINVSFKEILNLLTEAKVGLHTMWNEHFGICVVELMAAGLITIAHNSGGPKSDIILPGETGFLATSPKEYADLIATSFKDFDKFDILRQNARKEVSKYSDEAFFSHFSEAVSSYI